jgi:nucleoside-diphosphate-sugar epimerase
MRVMVTGAAGFIGMALTRHLLHVGGLATPTGQTQPISELVLVDRQAVTPPSTIAVPVRTTQVDLADADAVKRLAEEGFDSVFHLAASLTLDAEADPGQAYRINVASIRHLIENAPRPPRFLFASSIAVFGGALPEVVDDTVRATPDTTYGTHKAMVELLLANYSRLGQADARVLRLPIVLIRPGAPTPTVSDRVAAIVRDALAGREVVCGLKPETRIPVASAHAVARALVGLHDVPVARLPHARAMNLPALTVSVREILQSVSRHAGDARASQVRYEPDAVLQRIVDSWPKRFVSEHADALRLSADADFDAIVDHYRALA